MISILAALPRLIRRPAVLTLALPSYLLAACLVPACLASWAGTAPPAAAATATGTATGKLDTAEQDRLLQRVQQWFADTRSLKADFVQINNEGKTATGKVWLRRPGRVRFEYDPPVPLMIVSDGLFVIFVDKQLDQVDRLPLIRSPLSILTADKVNIRKDTLLRGLSQEGGLIRLTVADKDAPDEGEITLVFQDDPVALKQWIVHDAADRTTTITLQNTVINPSLPTRLFVYSDPAPGSDRIRP